MMRKWVMWKLAAQRFRNTPMRNKIKARLCEHDSAEGNQPRMMAGVHAKVVVMMIGGKEHKKGYLRIFSHMEQFVLEVGSSPSSC